MAPKSRLLQLVAANGLYWVGLLVATGGVAYCSAGAYLGLRQRFDPSLAALLTGLGLLGLVALASTVVVLRLRARSRRQKRREVAKTEQMLQELVGEVMGEWAQERTRQALVGALVAGFVSGASPAARKRLGELVDELPRPDQQG